MLKLYRFTDHDGTKLEAVASDIVEAIRLSGVVSPVMVNWAPWLNCSGDCGDCNDLRQCASREQAL